MSLIIYQQAHECMNLPATVTKGSKAHQFWCTPSLLSNHTRNSNAHRNSEFHI